MRFSKLAYPLLFTGLISNSSFATTIMKTAPWGSIKGGLGAGVYYIPEYGNEPKYFDATVSHSKSGAQRIYFTELYAGSANICNYETNYSTTITMIFNGQAVKMMRWCKKFKSSNHYYYDYTPATNHGDNYVINLFKKSTAPIKIQIDNDTIFFPVLGFTRVWNSAGGNAI